MASAAVIARILTQYSDKGSKAAQKDIARLEKKISAFGKKAVKSFALAGVAATAFAVKLGVDAVKGAAADQKQQIALATALRNTTGATDEAIAANIKYLDSLELQVAIDNEKLIPALQKLVTATGDLGKAQSLLSLATDVSAASGKDLSSVATAMSRALGGNFTALTRLGLPLDQNAIKTKNLEKLFEDLAKVSKGQASAAAATFEGKMEKLRLTIAQTVDKIGYALIPVIEEYATYIINDVIPAIDKWVAANEGKLAKSFEGVVTMVAAIVKNLVTLTVFIEKYKEIALVIAGIPLFGAVIAQGKILLGIMKVVTPAINAVFTMKTLGNAKALGGLLAFIGKTFKTGGILAGFRSLLQLLSMVNPYVKVFTILAAGLGIAAVALNKVFGGSDKVAKKSKLSAEEARKAAEYAAKASVTAAETAKKNEAIRAAIEAKRKKDEAARVKSEKMAEAARKKAAAIEAKTAALKKRIESLTGLKITDADEYELIQLTAVEKLQKKQKEADASLEERIKLRKEELTLFNSLTAKTAQYLDFLKAINSDGKLDDSEIAKLMSKWNLTQTAASKYADFVYAIGDRKLSDIEIENLKNKWGLTTKQVVDYLAKIGAPVDAKGTALSAGDIAALGWKNASSALDDYNAKLKGAGVTPPPPPTMNPPISGGVQELIDREMAIDKPYMPGDLGYSGTGGQNKPSPLTGSSLYGGGIDYSRLFSSSTLDNGMSLMSDAFSSSGGTTNINLAVYGSVTSEQDLVQTIRQGLLQGQSSGYGLLLQEI
jgi:hypothetical protein